MWPGGHTGNTSHCHSAHDVPDIAPSTLYALYRVIFKTTLKGIIIFCILQIKEIEIEILGWGRSGGVEPGVPGFQDHGVYHRCCLT